jgi:hypothetical protein
MVELSGELVRHLCMVVCDDVAAISEWDGDPTDTERRYKAGTVNACEEIKYRIEHMDLAASLADTNERIPARKLLESAAPEPRDGSRADMERSANRLREQVEETAKLFEPAAALDALTEADRTRIVSIVAEFGTNNEWQRNVELYLAGKREAAAALLALQSRVAELQERPPNSQRWSDAEMQAALATARAEGGSPLGRDADWAIAMGHALGLDSGFRVPIIPSVEAFKELFAAIRAKGNTA